MADPDRFSDIAEIAGEIQDLFIPPAGQRTMLHAVDMLEIKQHQVGAVHEPLQLGKKPAPPA